MDKLKPCPFCGGKAKLEHINDTHLCYVMCTKCCATSTGFVYFTDSQIEKAIAAWNRRADNE